MTTTFRILSEKEVINCKDGSVIGCVSDIEISTDDCRVTALFVNIGGNIFSKQEKIRIPWENIEKIGYDVIIVSCAPICKDNESYTKDKKWHFLSKGN